MADIKELKEKIQDLKVLFVDDEAEIRDGTGTFLKKFFNDVMICEDGVEGLEAYKKSPTQIIITDVLMPRMDGVAMVKEIKKLNADVFVIVITAFRETLDNDPELINMHIKKPLSYEDMVKILNIISEQYGK